MHEICKRTFFKTLAFTLKLLIQKNLCAFSIEIVAIDKNVKIMIDGNGRKLFFSRMKITCFKQKVNLSIRKIWEYLIYIYVCLFCWYWHLFSVAFVKFCWWQVTFDTKWKYHFLCVWITLWVYNLPECLNPKNWNQRMYNYLQTWQVIWPGGTRIRIAKFTVLT